MISDAANQPALHPEKRKTQVKILDIRPEPPGFGSTIARVDIALSDQCKLFNLKLVAGRDGTHRVYAPSAFGTNTATFAPELAAQIARAAITSLGEKTTDDQRAA